MSSAYHALTVDVEDWYHVCGIGKQIVVPRDTWRVRHNIEKILCLFEQYQCKATFFMLGAVAESLPELAPMIAAQGHEIASHGYSHRLLSEMDEQQFRDDLQQTEEILLRQTGQRPVGYRAPQWSVSSQTPWVNQVLSERCYQYDSSRNPLPFIGDSSASRYPYLITTDKGSLWEIPPLVTKTALVHLPTGGGWGFRFFPLDLIVATIDDYERAAASAVFYLHPREVDPDGPRLPLSPLKRFVTYGTRTDATVRITELLKCYRFKTLAEMVSAWQPVS